MMPTPTRSRALDVWHTLRHLTSERELRAFARQDVTTHSAQYGLPWDVMITLHEYARCREWSLFYRRTGQPRRARREAALAGVQTRSLQRL